MDGFALLDAMEGRTECPPVVVITALDSSRVAVEAMKRGALDYFEKPFDAEAVVPVIQRSLEHRRLSNSNARLRAVHTLAPFMVFTSPSMVDLAVRIDRMRGRDPQILIQGETGVGKERVARALVETSKRAEAPYVVVSAATLSPELAGAELFGHSAGAFTGAREQREGLFRAADGGTLLIDEVGELSSSVQAALLRVLQEGEVRPLGCDRPIPVDVRVIAATHRDLKTDPDFRRDLYYRLAVVTLNVPPLRQRPEDIPGLVQHFLTDMADRYGLARLRLTPDVQRTLQARPWPGNVRELKNKVESLAALSDGEVIDRATLELIESGPLEAPTGLRAQVEQLERCLIEEALRLNNGNRSAAARALQIGRVSLLERIKKYGFEDR
jgi:two-component system response regulator HydG